jgi:Mn2+/Fe2+ NRAMP family transporter
LGLLNKFRFLGPGFILSASIVGSGELIATTVLGAKAGFTALWIIILSCLIKVAVQLEVGRHAILTGETPMVAFNKLPGIKIRNCNWSVWTVFFIMLMKIFQLGGMLGGTALVMTIIFPTVGLIPWTIIVAAFVGLLIYNGHYKSIERLSLSMIAFFTVFTVVALFSLQYTEFKFSFTDILNGLEFNLSPAVVAVAIGAFGITGVGSDEIIAYNYWCLEKGYATYAGPRQETPAWLARARGWIRVMYLDALVSMIVYTAVTVVFYLLGAAVLYRQDIVPEGNQVIKELALIYTQSLSQNIELIYLVGAFFVLFSSLFASLGAWTRVFTDIFSEMRLMDYENLNQRKRAIKMLALAFPALWAIAYFFIQSPVLMVLSGGVLGSILLLLVVYASWVFYKRTTGIIKTSIYYRTSFWASVISIFLVAVYGLVKVF